MSRIDQYPLGTRVINPASDFVFGIVSGQAANIPYNSIPTSAQYIQGSTGSVARTITNKFQDVVNGKDFGMKADGITDDTAALRAAIATGGTVVLPSGQILLTDAITMATKGQLLKGQGRQQTVILIPATFNLSALGVFVATSGEEGPIFRDFKIQFTQPDTAVRANLTAFPPAFYLRSTPRFLIQNVKVTLAMTGIDMAGGTNSGGATIDNLELSAFNVGIDIDGALDSVRLDKLHFYPFDLSVNQTSIFNDGAAIGVRSGRADDFHLSNSLFLTGGIAAKFIQTASGNTFGSITNTDFDTYGGLAVQAGQIQIADSLFTVGSIAYQAINQTGGYVSCSACKFYANVATTNPLVQVSGTNTAYAQIDNSLFQFTADMQAASVAASSGGNTLILNGNQFLPPQNTSPTNPIVNVGTGGRITAIGNRVLDKGTGTGNFITVAVDDQHTIAGNAIVGWGLSLPAILTNTIAFGNSNGNFVNKFLGSLNIADLNTSSISNFQLSAINDTNGVNLKLIGNGATTPSKTIRVNSGTLQFVNDAYTSVIASLTDAGGLSSIGGVSTSLTGVYTNTQMNTPSTFLLNGLSPNTEYTTEQGTNYDTEAVTGGISVPASATVHQASAIAGYVNNSSTTTNAVGAYFSARSLATSTKNWAINTVVDDGGFASTILGYEMDVGVKNVNSTVTGLGVTGVFGALNPASSTGVQVATFLPSNTGKWAQCFLSTDGASNYVFSVGAQAAAAANINGQIFNLRSYDQTSTARNITIQAVAATSSANLNVVLPTNGIFSVTGILDASAGLRVQEAANSKQGAVTLVGGTVTVSNTSVTANSRIFVTSQGDGGTPGFLRVSSRVAGTSFTITSSSATDTSVVAYEIFEPG